MKKNILLFMLLLLSIANYAQDISYTFDNPRNTNDGVDDFYEVDIYASSTTEFKMGDVQLRFFYNTAAFGQAVNDNGVLESLTPAGSLFGSALFGGAVPKFALLNIANTLDSFTIVYEAKVSDGTFTENTITATPTHLFSIKLKYTDLAEAADVTFSTEAADQDQVFTACGPFDASPFTNADCIGFPGQQLLLADVSFDSAGAALASFVEWSGITSTVWDTATNWVGDVLPTTTDDVSIADVTNSPVIASGEAFTVNAFTVETAAALAINDSGYLRVDGNFTNDGTITMTSTAAESASLLVKGSATGVVTYERGGLIANEFSIVTAPVAGQSVKAFVENAANDIRINTTVTPNRLAIGFYDETQPAGSKWVYYTTDDIVTDALTFEQGRGYAISRGTNGSVSFTGTIETASVTKALETEWNAIGNPFTTFLPANENGGANFIADNTSKINPANLGIYVWDNAQAKYVVVPGSGSASFIAPGQGFFVRAAAGATDVSFDEAQRMKQPITGGTFSKGTNSEKSGFTLTASTGAKSVTTLVNYSNTTTKGLDPGYDLGNFAGAEFDVFTKLVGDTAGEDFTIQSLPLETEEATNIPVGLVAKAGTTIRFSIAKDNLDTAVYLEDTVLNVVTKLEDTAYEVTVSEDTNGSGRFFLKTESSKVLAVDAADISSIKVYTSNEALVVKGIVQGEFNLQLFNVLGKEVFKAKETGIGNNTLDLPSLQIGVYLVKVNSSLGTTNSKIIIK